MDAEQVNDEQTKLIRRVVSLAPSGWKRIFVNYEMSDTDEGMVSDCIAFAVRKKMLRNVERVDIETGANEWQLLNNLGRHLMTKAGQKHITLDLLIREDGTFKTFVDYEPPVRLGGKLDAVKRHLKYASEDEYLRELD